MRPIAHGRDLRELVRQARAESDDAYVLVLPLLDAGLRWGHVIWARVSRICGARSRLWRLDLEAARPASRRADAGTA